jgi:hypothetical protein
MGKPTAVKHVKIHAGRGHGDGLWRVLSEIGVGCGSEYELESCETGEKIRIYQAHTYQDVKMRLTDSRQNRDNKQAIVAAILANADKRSKKGK